MSATWGQGLEPQKTLEPNPAVLYNPDNLRTIQQPEYYHRS
jgi:hypothetical protein